jgi:hypothetical protein
LQVKVPHGGGDGLAGRLERICTRT